MKKFLSVLFAVLIILSSTLTINVPVYAEGEDNSGSIDLSVEEKYEDNNEEELTDFSESEQITDKNQTSINEISEQDEDGDNYSGTCGDDLAWIFDPNTGILTISGSGNMYDYTDYGDTSAPWQSFKESINRIVFDGEITSIGNYAFFTVENITEIEIPDSVSGIGYYAFYACKSLMNVVLPASLTEIKAHTFYQTSLKTISIPSGVTAIRLGAFNYCRSLETVFLPVSVTTIERYAFYDPKVLTIYYSGNEEQFKEISGYYNWQIYGTVYYNSSGLPDGPIELTPVAEMMKEDDNIDFNKNEYKLFDDALTWQEAEAYCESIGGHLAIITSEKEQRAVNSLLRQGNKKYYWLGAQADSNGHTYHWLDGDYINYNHWKSGTVFDNHYLENGNIIALGSDSEKIGFWDTADSSFYYDNKDSFGFVCQLGPIGRITDSDDVTIKDFYGPYSMVLYNNYLFQYYNRNMLGYFMDAYDYMTADDPDVPNIIDGKYWKNILVPSIKWSGSNAFSIERARYSLITLTGYDFDQLSGILEDIGIVDMYETTEDKILDDMILSLIQEITDNAKNTANGNNDVSLAYNLYSSIAHRDYIDDNYKPLADLCFTYKSNNDIDDAVAFLQDLPVFQNIDEETIKEMVKGIMRMEDDEELGDYFEMIKAQNKVFNEILSVLDVVVAGAIAWDLQYELIACLKSYYPEGTVIYQGFDRLERKIQSQNFVGVMVNMVVLPEFQKLLERKSSDTSKSIIKEIGEELTNSSVFGAPFFVGKLIYKCISIMIPRPSFDDYIKANNARAMAVETWCQLQDERADIVLAHQNGNDLDSTNQIAKDRMLYSVHIAAMSNAVSAFKEFLKKAKNDTIAINYSEKINLLQNAFDNNEIHLDYDGFMKLCVNEIGIRYHYYFKDESTEDTDVQHSAYAYLNTMSGIKDSNTEDSEQVIYINALASYSNAEDVSGLMVLPSMIEGQEVEGIAERAFVNNDDITAVYIPGTIKSIGAYSFYNCPNLKVVMIDDGVQEIGDFVFASCDNLVFINIPASVSSVGNNLFDDCNENLLIDLTETTATEQLLELLPDHVEASDKKPVSMSIYAYPEQLSLNTLEELNTDGLQISVVYDTGVTEVLPEGFTVVLSDRKPGTNTAMVYYKGLCDTYDVVITDNICSYTVKYVDEFCRQIADLYYGTAEYGSVIELPYSEIEGYTVDDNSLTATVKNNAVYEVKYISNKLDIADAILQIDETDYLYTSEEIRPEVHVYDGDKELENYTDYICWYTDNIEEGTATVHVMGINGYKGEKTGEFTISYPGGLWFTGVEDLTFTGSALKQNNLRVFDHGTLLKEGTDYSVSYSKNVHAGTAVITITGKGNYKDKETIEFNILPKLLTDEDVTISDIATVLETGKTQYLKPVVKWNSKALKLNTDYTLEYNDVLDDRTAYLDPGSYTVTVNGKGDYEGLVTSSYEIAAKDQTLISKVSLTKLKDIPYDGQSHTPDVVLKDPKTKALLINGTDYVISYSEDTVHVGTVTLTITGKGNYKGIRTTSFKITGVQLSKAKLNNFQSSLDYNDGLPVLQNISFTISNKDKTVRVLNGISLANFLDLSAEEREEYDYVYEYSDNTLPGKATVTFTGINGYLGTVKKAFTIKGIEIKKTKMENLTESFIYNGNEKTQDDLVLTYQKDKNSEPVLLMPEDDYELEYSDNIKAGKATLNVKGKGIYTGTVKKTFKITPYDIHADTDGKIRVVYDNVVIYNKSGSKPDISVYYGDVLLSEGTDYTVSYKNNTSVTDPTNSKQPVFEIKGKGNFTGTVSDNRFSIVQRDLAEGITVTISDKTYSTSKNTWKSTPILMDGGKKLSAGTDYDKNIVYTYLKETEILDGSNKDKPSVTRISGEEVQPSDIIPAGTLIEATVSGIKNYKGTVSVDYRITKADISKAKVSVVPKVYTGEEIFLTPEDITITFNKTVLDENDYFIDDSSYSKNINKGKATVMIKGIGDFGGSKTITFTIGSKSFLWWWRNLWQ